MDRLRRNFSARRDFGEESNVWNHSDPTGEAMERTNRREEMLRIAFDILATDGLEGLHARTLAARMGVNHATVHYYFPTRSDLLRAVWASAESQFIADWESRLASGKNPRRRLLAVLDGLRSEPDVRSAWHRVFLSLQAAAAQDPVLAESIRQFWMAQQEAWKELLQSAKDDGALVKGSPLADPALWMVLMLGGGLGRLVAGAHPLDDKAFTRLTDALLK